MKTKHLALLGVIFIALLALVKGLEYLNRNEGKTVVQDFLSVTSEDIDKISLEKTDTVNILQKTGTGWQLTQPVTYPANATNVKTLLSKLDDFKTDNTISSNADKQATFEVNDDSGLKVTLFRGESQLAQFYIGKIAPDSNHTYVRMAGSDDIKTARGSLKSLFDRKTLDWRDKSILALDQGSITAITVSKQGSDPYTLTKGENGTWQVQGSTDTLDTSKVTTLLSSVSTLNCTDFVDDPTTLELNFDIPALTVDVTSGSSQVQSIAVVTLADKYYARKSGSEQIFVVAKYAFDNLGKQPADLKPAST